jgi:hypothetical protein
MLYTKKIIIFPYIRNDCKQTIYEKTGQEKANQEKAIYKEPKTEPK